MDLQIIKQELPIIKFNFDELKEQLNKNLEKYRGIVVTEETLKDSKATKRELSKLKKEIDAKRIEIKKKVSVPISEFEKHCNELTGLIADVEIPIQEGIKEFDDKERERKGKIALKHIKNIVEHLGLSDKYANQLTVTDKYTQLSTNIKFIKEDIEARANELKESQTQEEQIKQAIINQIAAANEMFNLDNELTESDVKYVFEYDVATAISEIIRVAKGRKDSEDKAKEKERERIEKAAEEERQKAEEEKKVKEVELPEEGTNHTHTSFEFPSYKEPTESEFIDIRDSIGESGYDDEPIEEEIEGFTPVLEGEINIPDEIIFDDIFPESTSSEHYFKVMVKPHELEELCDYLNSKNILWEESK